MLVQSPLMAGDGGRFRVPTPRLTVTWSRLSLAQDDQHVYFLLEAALGGALFDVPPQEAAKRQRSTRRGGSFRSAAPSFDHVLLGHQVLCNHPEAKPGLSPAAFRSYAA